MWYAVFICTSGQNVVFGVNCHHGAALYPDGAKLNAFGIFKKITCSVNFGTVFRPSVLKIKMSQLSYFGPLWSQCGILICLSVEALIYKPAFQIITFFVM